MASLASSFRKLASGFVAPGWPCERWVSLGKILPDPNDVVPLAVLGNPALHRIHYSPDNVIGIVGNGAQFLQDEVEGLPVRRDEAPHVLQDETARLLGLQRSHDVCDDAPSSVAVRHTLPQANCRERLARNPSDVDVMVWQMLRFADHDVSEHDVLGVALGAFWSPCLHALCDQAATMTVPFAREDQLEGVQEAKAFKHPWQRLHA